MLKAITSRKWPDFAEALSQPKVNFPNRMGHIVDKVDALRMAPVSIVIENSADYVSEKVFDAIAAGVLPLRVGPKDSELGFPPEAAVSLDPSPRNIVDALLSLDSEEVAYRVSVGRKWMETQRDLGALQEPWRPLGEMLASIFSR